MKDERVPVSTIVPAGGRERRRRRDELRRALWLEASVQSNYLLGAFALGVVVLLLSLVQVSLGIILILLAVLAPYTLARGVPPRIEVLRAASRISRADAVRARVVLIALVQVALVVMALGAIALAADPTASARPSETRPLHGVLLFVDASTWAPAIVWAWVFTGRDCLRRPWAPAAFSTVVAYLIVSSLLGLFFEARRLAPISVNESTLPSATEIALQLGCGAAVLMAGIGVLAWRARTWTRTA